MVKEGLRKGRGVKKRLELEQEKAKKSKSGEELWERGN